MLFVRGASRNAVCDGVACVQCVRVSGVEVCVSVAARLKISVHLPSYL
jgi:hypothetical protein